MSETVEEDAQVHLKGSGALIRQHQLIFSSDSSWGVLGRGLAESDGCPDVMSGALLGMWTARKRHACVSHILAP